MFRQPLSEVIPCIHTHTYTHTRSYMITYMYTALHSRHSGIADSAGHTASLPLVRLVEVVSAGRTV